MAAFRLTLTARARLKTIGAYTQKQWGVDQRNRYLLQLDKGLHDLADRPDRGRLRPELAVGLFSLTIQKHVVFYQIQSDHIVIVDILHERMEPSRHLPKV